MTLYSLALTSVTVVAVVSFASQWFITASEHLAYARPYGILFVAPGAMLTALENVVRLDDTLTAVKEAATNAIQHGRDGEAWVGGGEVTILISDHSGGIQPHDLARATPGLVFPSQPTLGLEYHLMLQTIDLLALSTSDDGNDVLLRVGSRALASAEEQFLRRLSLQSAA